MPMSLLRKVEKFVQVEIPNLSRCKDFSDFITKSIISESEVEEKGTSAIRLYEVDPRLTIHLIKIDSRLV